MIDGRLQFSPWLPGFCLLVILLLLAPGLLGEFTADDLYVYRIYTTPDCSVAWGAVFADFYGAWQGNDFGTFYRPLVSLSLGIDFALGGGLPAFTLIGNLLLHLGAVLLVFLLGMRIFGGPLPAMLAALVFGLHPVCIEGVCWGVGRSEALSTIFPLLGSWLLLRAREKGSFGAGTVITCGLALLTKETGLLFPLVPLTLELATTGWRRVRPAPYLVMAGLIGIYALWRIFIFGYLLGSEQNILHFTPTAVVAGYYRLLHFFFLPTSLATTNFYWLTPACFISIGLAFLVLPGQRLARCKTAGLLALGALLFMAPVHQNPCDPETSIRGCRWVYIATPLLALATAALLPRLNWQAMLFFLLLPLALLGPVMHAEAEAWGDAGHAARTVRSGLTDEAARLQLGKPMAPLPVLNTLRSYRGVEIYHAGELGLIAAPPFLPERIHMLGLETLWTRGNHLEVLPFLGNPPQIYIAGTAIDPQMIKSTVAKLRQEAKPLAPGNLGLGKNTEKWLGADSRLSIHGVEPDKTIMVFATAIECGIATLQLIPGKPGTYGLPAPFKEAIRKLLRDRGAGDTVAFYLENRMNTKDRSTAYERTRPVYRIIR